MRDDLQKTFTSIQLKRSESSDKTTSNKLLRKQSTMVRKTGHMFDHYNVDNSEDSFSDTSVHRIEDYGSDFS